MELVKMVWKYFVGDQAEASIPEMHIEDKANPFSRLPVEVVENILSFVNFYDLEECLLVDKQFNDVIASSRKLMSRFVLHIKGNNFGNKDLNEIAAMSRRYQKLKIFYLTDNEMENVFAGIQEITCKATEVEIENSGNPHNRQLLPCFPNVTKLIIKDFSGRAETLSPNSFPKLKYLKLFNAGSIHIASGLWNLDTLDVLCEEGNSEQVLMLLANQKSLDTLRLEFNNLEALNFQLSLHPELKIRRLLVDGFDYTYLLALQVTLQFEGKVECLQYFGPCYKDNLQPLMQHFSTIKALSLERLPKDDNFYRTARINGNLTALVVKCQITCKALLGAFDLFPNLKRLSIQVFELKISELMQEELVRLRGKLNQLEKFTVASGPERDLNVLKQLTQKITDLYLTLDKSPIDYKSLKTVCENVTFLSIEGDRWNGFAQLFSLELVLESVPKLETLQLGSDIVELFKWSLMRVIQKKLKNLKLLRLKYFRKNTFRTLNQKARLLGIEGLSITKINGRLDFDFNNSGVFQLD